MMSRRILCALLCAGLLVSTSFAQGGGNRRGGGGGGQPPRGGMGGGMGANLVALAKAKDVAADLKLSDDQVKKLDELDKKMSEKRREMFQGGGGGDREAMMEKMRELTKETDKELAAVVNADQMKRLKQISLQASEKQGGLMAVLGNPEVVEKLSLSAEQKEQLQGFREDMMRSMQEIRQEAGDDREAMMKKITEYRTSMGKKVSKLLNDDQKAKLKSMEGEPFKGEFPAPQMGRRKNPPV
jgi:hypothetical protein